MKNFCIFLSIIAFAGISLFSGCSGNSNPMNPESAINALPDDSINIPDNRNAVAVYNATIDPVSRTFSISQADRNADYHAPLSKYFPLR
jgi:hypothetical protein